MAHNQEGWPDFHSLHSRAGRERADLVAFDLLMVNGEDIRRWPLIERRGWLAKLMRDAPQGLHFSEHLENGKARLVTRSMTWEDYVHLAFDEIRMAGADSPQVARRLRAALEDLLTVAPLECKAVLQDQLNLLQYGAERRVSEGSDRAKASRGDPSGLG